MSPVVSDSGSLALIMAQLSFLAIGGINATLPEMQRQVVDVHHWMSAEQFASLYALAQAAPGPNMLVTTLVGWQVAGVAGAFAATIGICGPSCVLSYFVAAIWFRFRHATWRRVLQHALTPVTCGLVFAAAAFLAQATTHNVGTALVMLASTIVLLLTKVHPLVVLGVAAALGAGGLVS
jgi:chromate transporter